MHVLCLCLMLQCSYPLFHLHPCTPSHLHDLSSSCSIVQDAGLAQLQDHWQALPARSSCAFVCSPRVLCSMMQSPFSFQAADEQRAAIKEAVAALAKNPNRFQVRCSTPS